jgi:hypothetical protein
MGVASNFWGVRGVRGELGGGRRGGEGIGYPVYLDVRVANPDFIHRVVNKI